MKVEELIEQLLKIRDKSQNVLFFNSDALFDEQETFNFNNIFETKVEGEDAVLISWKN